ncbi:hypothetical protein FA15DRAFT_660468 [Coprinopsis marcescibilis]|uniref:Uncharacterized protein n=1 Tax=Coprinopsis marcescibilis TaxID=230819 RepID=A0A5C3KSF0_COPMA|nr:hypothetical protein FA15DRAFT_660468 [Coprinopsis marcescibilis]
MPHIHAGANIRFPQDLPPVLINLAQVFPLPPRIPVAQPQSPTVFTSAHIEQIDKEEEERPIFMRIRDMTASAFVTKEKKDEPTRKLCLDKGRPRKHSQLHHLHNQQLLFPSSHPQQCHKYSLYWMWMTRTALQDSSIECWSRPSQSHVAISSRLCQVLGRVYEKLKLKSVERRMIDYTYVRYVTK